MMKTFNNIIEEGLLGDREDIMKDANKEAEKDLLVEYQKRMVGHKAKDEYDILGNKLKEGDWVIMPLGQVGGFEWRVGLIVKTKGGKLVPMSCCSKYKYATNNMTRENCNFQTHKGIGTRDCIKIDDIEKFLGK